MMSSLNRNAQRQTSEKENKQRRQTANINLLNFSYSSVVSNNNLSHDLHSSGIFWN